MSVKELIEAARRLNNFVSIENERYDEDRRLLADFAARLLLSLDAEAVERLQQRKGHNGNTYFARFGVLPTDDTDAISAAVIAALGE